MFKYDAQEELGFTAHVEREAFGRRSETLLE